MLEQLRERAQECRRRAERARTAIGRHLFIAAAARYETAVEGAAWASASEAEAVRYERAPGGAEDAEPAA